MKLQSPTLNTTYLKDYRVPDFMIEKIDLHFELGQEKTLVRSVMKVYRNSNQREISAITLEGEELKLVSLSLNDNVLEPSQYEVTPTHLTIFEVPDSFTLEMITEITPQNNTALSGLYRSGNLFCTQCEAQGFRRITYYLDRPDVMAFFTTTIVADKTKYPVLLSNGNKIEMGELSHNRHYVKWQDPFKKPSYLFALVAGDLVKISDFFITKSNRHVDLEIFVEPENKDKCHYALASLKRAMRWDEERYGREYDLDVYMIVAVNDFNMGAMENKGLNIFNSKYILADEITATDVDFQNVEAVVGHEYFHNWTGNRITCRDWFQLSLKEGLTVFREQQFSAEMGSETLERINQVKIIRTRQFAEDAGPMSHPVRPDSYVEINNFYTTTVYNKGSEVIRMLHTILGENRFQKGMNLYFEKYDGQAVTIEDFIGAFSEANDLDLTQFKLWYSQSGTPQVSAKSEYDSVNKQFKLTLSQSCPQTADQKEKKPFVIPIKIALFDEKGDKLALQNSNLIKQDEEAYLILDSIEKEFVFDNVFAPAVPSLLGNFSAPVKLTYPYTRSELANLMMHDTDLFNRWDAAQRLNLNVIKTLVKEYQEKKAISIPPFLIEAYRKLLTQTISEPAFLAQLIVLPSFQYISQEYDQIDVQSVIAVKRMLMHHFVNQLQEELFSLYQTSHQNDQGTFNRDSIAYRSLKNVCLSYLCRIEDPKWSQLAQDQYQKARNMTEIMGALNAINHDANRKALFEDFYHQFKHDPLVVNKWLALQAQSDVPNVLENIKALLKHPAFDIRNPNKVYALINTFYAANPERYHEGEGEGYQFIADRVIELNQLNPQVAARVIEGITQFKRLDDNHQNWMKSALIRVAESGKLSDDIDEIVTKSLA